MRTSIYNLDYNNSGVEIFVGSSSFFRELILNPEIRGREFQNKFSKGLNEIFSSLIENEKASVSEMLSTPIVDILYVLRGGLNFDVHNQLPLQVSCEVSFCSSQRVIEGDQIYNAETGYSKWNLHDNSLLVIGDISATGTTITFAVNQAVAQYKKENKVPAGILILTVGTANVLPVVKKLSDKLKHSFGGKFKGITVLFLEGIFHLNMGSASYATLNLGKTDFFVKDFPRTVALELDKLNNPTSFFERCVIYDGGSRSFEPSIYKENILRYWEGLYKISDSISIEKFLQDRTDLYNYKKLSKEKRNELLLTDEEQLRETFIDKIDETLSKVNDIGLKAICEERLTKLNK